MDLVRPAAGVLVQVRAGETLIALTGSQKPPGLLSAANLDPHQVWFNRRRERGSLLAAASSVSRENPFKEGGSCAPRRALTFHVGVSVLVVAEPQRHPFLQRHAARGVQQVVQKLVVDLIEGHPDGVVHALGQVVSSAV